MGTNIRQNADGSVGFVTDDGAVEVQRLGGVSTPNTNTATFRGIKVAKVALGTGTSGGGVLAWANPEGVPVGIVNIEIYTTTKSTGASTIDVGTAANATTSSDNLIDGLDTGTAVVFADNNTDKGTNGKTRQLMSATQYVTASQASGAVAGLVGYAYISYVVL